MFEAAHFETILHEGHRTLGMRHAADEDGVMQLHPARRPPGARARGGHAYAESPDGEVAHAGSDVGG